MRKLMRNREAPHVALWRLPLHIRFYLGGTFVLIAGLIGAVVIYLATGDDASGGLGLDIGGDKREEFQLERIGGKAAVFAVQFDQWFDSLWHGKQLAYTLAFLSVGVALVCFLLAHRLSLNAPRDHTDGPEV